MRNYLLLFCAVLCAFPLFSQVPQAFSYQAIARNAEGKPLAGETVDISVKILQSGNTVYSETSNSLTTNEFGLFTLQVGKANPGSFSSIDWSLSDYSLEVDVSGAVSITTTTPILSVPFALLADEVVHEHQTLALNGTQLSIEDGNTVTLPTGTTYIAGNGININGNTISTNDLDPDPSNEIQQLSLNGAQLSLSNGGNSVTLPTGTTYTAGSGIAINGNAISNTGDLSNTNEIQQLSVAGNQLTLTNGGNTVTLPTGTTYTAGSGINIAANTISATDNSATNEIQLLAYNATNSQLSISGTGGNAVTLPVSQWQNTTGGIYYDAGKVGVGTDAVAAHDEYLVVRDGIATLNAQGEHLWQVLKNADGSIYSTLYDDAGTARAVQGLTPFGSSNMGALNGESISNIEATADGSVWYVGKDLQGTIRAELGYTSINGRSYMGVFSDNGTGGIIADTNPDGSHIVSVNDNNGLSRAFMGINALNRSFFGLRGAQGSPEARAGLAVNESDVEYYVHRGANMKERVLIAPYLFQAGNGGSLMVKNEQGEERANLFSSTSNEGHLSLFNYDHTSINNSLGIEIFGKSSTFNPRVRLYNNNAIAASMYLDDATGKGSFSLIENGSFAARMYVNASGVGNLELNGVKSFVIPHPTLPDKEIVYACIEGPEAAVYLRGTATLVNGEATVKFPEEFTLVANAKGMTIQMTPQSADAMGLAAVERSAEGFKVKELLGGTGNYEFDWEVKAVRKGFENFEVVRDKRKIDNHAEK